MAVKPRYEETSSEVNKLLEKAIKLEERIEKAQPGYSTTFNTNPGGVEFMAESGGQTRNVFYNTNQNLLDSEDVTNKGATSESIDLDATPMTERGNQKGRLVEG